MRSISLHCTHEPQGCVKSFSRSTKNLIKLVISKLPVLPVLGFAGFGEVLGLYSIYIYIPNACIHRLRCVCGLGRCVEACAVLPIPVSRSSFAPYLSVSSALIYPWWKETKLISVMLTCDNLLWLCSMTCRCPPWNNSNFLKWLISHNKLSHLVSCTRRCSMNYRSYQNKHLPCFVGGLPFATVIVVDTVHYISPVKHFFTAVNISYLTIGH